MRSQIFELGPYVRFAGRVPFLALNADMLHLFCFYCEF